MESPFSLRRAGLLLIVYVFSLMQQNLVVMALVLVNSGHMVNGQTPGKTTTLVSLSFSNRHRT